MAGFLVTGANGFVGQALGALLSRHACAWRPLLRRRPADWPADWPEPHIADLEQGDFTSALAGIDCVIHLAARVHVLDDADTDPLAAYRRVNRDASVWLARQAASNGVRRFIYLSSIKVNGEATGTPDQPHPFCVSDSPNPQDPYGVSKWEAEQALAQVARETGLQVVIIRPPLVYGPNVKANFLQLMRWVQRGLPLPLAWVQNRRSMVYVGNLVDLIWHCTRHPQAPGQVFLVSDGLDLSTAQLIRQMAQAMQRRAPLLPCPLWLLRLAARVMGKAAVASRLLGSLQVNIDATRDTLSWQAPFTPEQAMAATVAGSPLGADTDK